MILLRNLANMFLSDSFLYQENIFQIAWHNVNLYRSIKVYKFFFRTPGKTNDNFIKASLERLSPKAGEFFLPMRPAIPYRMPTSLFQLFRIELWQILHQDLNPKAGHNKWSWIYGYIVLLQLSKTFTHPFFFNALLNQKAFCEVKLVFVPPL